MTTRSTWLTKVTMTNYIHHTLSFKEYYEMLYYLLLFIMIV
jgi:hypothetical protein